MKKSKYSLQGAKVTTDILNTSRHMENHLVTKKTHTVFVPLAKRRLQSSALLDDL